MQYDALYNIPGLRVTRDAPLSEMTTFRIGGPCDLLCEPDTPEAAIELFRILPELHCPWTVLGRGSNTLCADSGFRGIVIRPLTGGGAERLFGDRVRVAAGMPLPRLSAFARDEGLAGLSFAQGIPGCVGGGLCMNSGAYEHTLSECVESVLCLCPGGEVRTIPQDACAFGYRESIFRRERVMALSAILKLSKGDPAAIGEEMRAYGERRAASQPLEFPSAGSVFKRPEGYFAGKLIQDAGLKGQRIGGAEVSEKHAGFIVNRGGASARDVLLLISLIQERVEALFGVRLEREVCLLGFEE